MFDSYKAIFNRAKPFVRISLTALFVLFIFLRFDFFSIIESIRDVSLWLYLVPILGHFVLMAIKALRWQLLLKSLHIHCAYGEALKAYIAGFAFGTFTPGQLGDIGKVMLIVNAGDQRKRALVSSIADRLWDLLGLVIVAGGGAFFLFLDHINLTKLFLCILAFCFVAFLVTPWTYRFTQKILLHQMDLAVDELFINWHWSLFLTAFALLVQFFRWAVLAVAFKLPIFTAATSAMIGTLVALVPVSFGGLGTRDAAIAALFSCSGLDPVVGVSFSFLMFGCYLVGSLAGVILLYTYKY